jgi:hypothetical protein
VTLTTEPLVRVMHGTETCKHTCEGIAEISNVMNLCASIYSLRSKVSVDNFLLTNTKFVLNHQHLFLIGGIVIVLGAPKQSRHIYLFYPVGQREQMRAEENKNLL